MVLGWRHKTVKSRGGDFARMSIFLPGCSAHSLFLWWDGRRRWLGVNFDWVYNFSVVLQNILTGPWPNQLCSSLGWYTQRLHTLIINKCTNTRLDGFTQAITSSISLDCSLHQLCSYLACITVSAALRWLGMHVCTYHSVAQQCVHCCKGDAASQWEMAILGVTELHNPWTDRLKIWHMITSVSWARMPNFIKFGGTRTGRQYGEMYTSRTF